MTKKVKVRSGEDRKFEKEMDWACKLGMFLAKRHENPASLQEQAWISIMARQVVKRTDSLARKQWKVLEKRYPELAE